MNELTKIERPACTLAECITGIQHSYEMVGKRQRQALENAYDVGQYLVIAKQQVEYGEWLEWVEQNCPFGRGQASKYMRLVEHWDAVLGKVKGDMQLGLDAALALITETPNVQTSEHFTSNGGVVSDSQTVDSEPQANLCMADDAEWEYVEKDEEEPLEEGEIDCGPVEEEEPVDWHKPRSKAVATCEALMRAVGDLSQVKASPQKARIVQRCDEIWEALKRW